MSCNVLVDSCSYFRLAQSIDPLLKTPFCEEGYTLGVIKELNEEYNKSPKLKHKFYWVDKKKHKENRKRCFTVSAVQKGEINNAFLFIRETAREEGFGVSRVDLTCLAYAHVFGIPVITDDADMISLAKEYDIESLTSLELLKILYDCRAIGIRKVRGIAAYWVYLNDTPKSYRKDYRKLFNEPAPS